jgi:hypothetical protein
MPELASIQTQPPQGSCPTAEDLACYIDGALSPEEAARVTEHLASCESCFEVYSGALEFQLESEAAPLGQVVPFPTEKRRPPVAWWSSIAALLVVGVGFGGYSYFLAPPPALITAQVTAPIQGKPALWLGETMRGGGGGGEEGQEAPLNEASFRMGVQIVNLQTRLKVGERGEARNLIAFILQVVKTQSSTSPLEESYTNFGEDIDKAKDVQALLPQASTLAIESRDYFDPLYFDLGQWVEAGRLAAISQDPTFFRQPENRSFLRRVLWRDRLGFRDSKLPAGSRPDLEAIYQISGQGALQPADFVKLQGHLKKILTANYPE